MELNGCYCVEQKLTVKHLLSIFWLYLPLQSSSQIGIANALQLTFIL